MIVSSAHMVKRLIFCFFLGGFILFGLPDHDSVQIMTPQEDEILYIGTSFEIMWETLEQGNTFFLFLRHGDEELGIIQDNIPGYERKCVWKVGAFQGGTAEASDNYHIMIRMYTDQGPIDKVSSRFSIYRENR